MDPDDIGSGKRPVQPFAIFDTGVEKYKAHDEQFHRTAIFFHRSSFFKPLNVSILVTIAVNKVGYQEVLGTIEGGCENQESWLIFLRHLKELGLKGLILLWNINVLD
ncbi:MAG: transposase [Clostridia bacterium]|jgi:hypothetical protein